MILTASPPTRRCSARGRPSWSARPAQTTGRAPADEAATLQALLLCPSPLAPGVLRLGDADGGEAGALDERGGITDATGATHSTLTDWIASARRRRNLRELRATGSLAHTWRRVLHVATGRALDAFLPKEPPPRPEVPPPPRRSVRARWEFKHPNFRRGRHDLLVLIRRDHDSDRIAPDAAVQRARQAELEREVADLRSKVANLTETLDKVVGVLASQGLGLDDEHLPPLKKPRYDQRRAPPAATPRTSCWTSDEEARLRTLVGELVGEKWKTIAERLGTGRTGHAVEQRWEKLKAKDAAPLPFAKALHKILGDAPQLIRLDAEEGCIVIPSPSALEGILGKYYRHSKYASFTRQLNNFGFDRDPGAGVTIYRRSPEAGGRIDSVDAILGIRHVVKKKKLRAPSAALEADASRMDEAAAADADAEVPATTTPSEAPKRLREKLIKWKLTGCTVAVTSITVVDEDA